MPLPLTLIAWGAMVRLCLDAAEVLSRDGVSAEVVDLRCLQPLDMEPAIESFKKTNRAVMVEEGWLGLWLVVQAAVWLFGVPMLLSIGLIWPGVLILAGVSALVLAVMPPDKLEAMNKRPRKAKRKAKRELPLPPVEEDATEEYFEPEPHAQQRQQGGGR